MKHENVTFFLYIMDNTWVLCHFFSLWQLDMMGGCPLKLWQNDRATARLKQSNIFDINVLQKLAIVNKFFGKAHAP